MPTPLDIDYSCSSRWSRCSGRWFLDSRSGLLSALGSQPHIRAGYNCDSCASLVRFPGVWLHYQPAPYSDAQPDGVAWSNSYIYTNYTNPNSNTHPDANGQGYYRDTYCHTVSDPYQVAIANPHTQTIQYAHQHAATAHRHTAATRHRHTTTAHQHTTTAHRHTAAAAAGHCYAAATADRGWGVSD